MKLKPTTIPLPALQKGQLWKTTTHHVEIVLVGKLLANYRLIAAGKKRGPTSIGTLQMVQEYLNAHGGTLVYNCSLTKT